MQIVTVVGIWATTTTYHHDDAVRYEPPEWANFRHQHAIVGRQLTEHCFQYAAVGTFLRLTSLILFTGGLMCCFYGLFFGVLSRIVMLIISTIGCVMITCGIPSELIAISSHTLCIKTQQINFSGPKLTRRFWKNRQFSALYEYLGASTDLFLCVTIAGSVPICIIAFVLLVYYKKQI